MDLKPLSYVSQFSPLAFRLCITEVEAFGPQSTSTSHNPLVKIWPLCPGETLYMDFKNMKQHQNLFQLTKQKTQKHYSHQSAIEKHSSVRCCI
jgi:hypothetical protein